jgi:hypothetical protein
MLVPPSEKITTPDGLATAVLPGLLTVTVAVKVVVCPDTAGAAEETTAVMVLPLLTVCVKLAVLAMKVLSPP